MFPTLLHLTVTCCYLHVHARTHAARILPSVLLLVPRFSSGSLLLLSAFRRLCLDEALSLSLSLSVCLRSIQYMSSVRAKASLSASLRALFYLSVVLPSSAFQPMYSRIASVNASAQSATTHTYHSYGSSAATTVATDHSYGSVTAG